MVEEGKIKGQNKGEVVGVEGVRLNRKDAVLGKIRKKTLNEGKQLGKGTIINDIKIIIRESHVKTGKNTMHISKILCKKVTYQPNFIKANNSKIFSI